MPHVDMARAVAVRRGVRLEVITVVWMVAEAIIAVGAGVAAKSLLLTALRFRPGGQHIERTIGLHRPATAFNPHALKKTKHTQLKPRQPLTACCRFLFRK